MFVKIGWLYPLNKVTVQKASPSHKQGHRAPLRPLQAVDQTEQMVVWLKSCLGFFIYLFFFLINTWVINPSLNDIIQSKSTGCLFAPQPLIHSRSQNLGHMIVVFAEVRVLLLGGVFHLRLVVRVTERHGWSLVGGRKGETVKKKTQTNRKIPIESGLSLQLTCTYKWVLVSGGLADKRFIPLCSAFSRWQHMHHISFVKHNWSYFFFFFFKSP